MEKIAYAIQTEQKIKIFYTDSNSNYYEPIIEPYGLKIADNHYLIAKEDTKLKTFKVSRISLLLLSVNFAKK